jgi:hypothetical protein
MRNVVQPNTFGAQHQYVSQAGYGGQNGTTLVASDIQSHINQIGISRGNNHRIIESLKNRMDGISPRQRDERGAIVVELSKKLSCLSGSDFSQMARLLSRHAIPDSYADTAGQRHLPANLTGLRTQEQQQIIPLDARLALFKNMLDCVVNRQPALSSGEVKDVQHLLLHNAFLLEKELPESTLDEVKQLCLDGVEAITDGLMNATGIFSALSTMARIAPRIELLMFTTLRLNARECTGMVRDLLS